MDLVSQSQYGSCKVKLCTVVTTKLFQEGSDERKVLGATPEWAVARSRGGRLGPLLVALSVGLHGERVAELAIAGRSHRSRPANHPALSCRGVWGKIKTWQS